MSGGGVGEEPWKSVGRFPAEAAAARLPQPGAGEAKAEGKSDLILASLLCLLINWNIVIAMDMLDSRICDSHKQGIEEAKKESFGRKNIFLGQLQARSR